MPYQDLGELRLWNMVSYYRKCVSSKAEIGFSRAMLKCCEEQRYPCLEQCVEDRKRAENLMLMLDFIK